MRHGTLRPNILGPKKKFVSVKHLYLINAQVTLTVHFTIEYKNAESPENITMISAAIIIQLFAFKYFIHFIKIKFKL